MPGAVVTLNGEGFRTLDAGGDALQVIEAIRLAEEGIYRFQITSSDGRIKTLSNPVWVRKDPPYRLYWGETHTHTGMAEGQGSIVRSYRFARQDARLDFMGLSEHDIWLDDLEWQTMRRGPPRATRFRANLWRSSAMSGRCGDSGADTTTCSSVRQTQRALERRQRPR